MFLWAIFGLFKGEWGESLIDKGLGLVEINGHHGLGSGSEKLHAAAQRKTEARGEKAMADERRQSSDPFQLFPSAVL